MDSGHRSSERPSRVRYRVMGLLLVLSFLSYFDRQCIVRVQQVVETELSLSKEQMGLVFGAFWLAYAAFEIPAGWLGDRFGARLALTRVVLAWSLFTALTGFAGGFVSLLTIRFLFGAGEAGAFPNMARVQATWLSPAARGRAGGWLWLAARWGGAFAPFLFAEVIRWFDSEPVRRALATVGLLEISGWRPAFLTAGIAGVVWCVVFVRWFRNQPVDHPGVNSAELELIRGDREAGPIRHGEMPPGVWRALLRSRSLWALMFLYVFGSFGWSFFVSWLPEYLAKTHGLAFEQSEQVWKQPLLYGGVSCLVGGIISDWLVRRLGSKRLARALLPVAGCVTAAAAVYAARFVSDAGSAVVLMCIAGAAYDFGQAANWATIVDVGGRYAGVATGLINFGNVGNVIQPWLGAWLFSHYDWNTLLAFLAGAFLLAATMWLFIDPRRTFYEENASAKRR
ncbi:MAG TPA: MFS transporter [Gemmataceae bacterium]|nr:MFS transporter [Gemmataceae bacterium]